MLASSSGRAVGPLLRRVVAWEAFIRTTVPSASRLSLSSPAGGSPKWSFARRRPGTAAPSPDDDDEDSSNGADKQQPAPSSSRRVLPAPAPPMHPAAVAAEEALMHGSKGRHAGSRSAATGARTQLGSTDASTGSHAAATGRGRTRPAGAASQPGSSRGPGAPATPAAQQGRGTAGSATTPLSGRAAAGTQGQGARGRGAAPAPPSGGAGRARAPGRGAAATASSPGRGGRATPSGRGPSRASRSGPAASEPQRLAKVMAAAGVASRRACEAMIAAGEVRVNGTVVQAQGTLVRPDKDVISVSGRKLALGTQPQLYYFMINKPKGYICSNVDTGEGKGKRVIDILQPWVEDWEKRRTDKKLLPPRFFTVGRLDVASVGLILVTNDGHWAQRVIHPSSEISKEYIVTVDKKVHQNELKAVMAGTEVEGVHVAPQEVSTLEGNLKLRVVIKEGKKHEVRMLVANAELEVQSLKRVRIGGLKMPSTLGLGAYKQMSPRDVKAVTDLSQQEKLRKNTHEAATMLMVDERGSNGDSGKR